MENKVAANIFGITGVVLWSVQLLPQIRWNYLRKSTQGVSILCFTSWYLGGIVLCPYLVATDKEPPLVIQISLFSLLILVILFQHFYYDKKLKLKLLIISLAVILCISVGVTYGLYELLKRFKSYDFEISLVITIFSAVFMAGGFIPAVYEIVMSQSAEGLSRLFVAMDFLGGTCSILSLVFEPPFDYMAFSTYVIVPCFEATIFTMSFYYGTQVKVKGIEYKEHDHVFVFNQKRSKKRRNVTIGERQSSSTTSTTIDLSIINNNNNSSCRNETCPAPVVFLN
eukprot:gene9908-12151_t